MKNNIYLFFFFIVTLERWRSIVQTYMCNNYIYFFIIIIFIVRLKPT